MTQGISRLSSLGSVGPVECRWRPSRPRQNHRQRPPRPWVRPHLQARRSERIAPLQETPAQTVASAGASGEQSTAVQQIDPSSGGGTRCDSGHLTAAGALVCGTCGIPMAAGQTTRTATPADDGYTCHDPNHSHDRHPGNDGHPRHDTTNPRRTDNNNPGCGHVRWATQRCPANPSPPRRRSGFDPGFITTVARPGHRGGSTRAGTRWCSGLRADFEEIAGTAFACVDPAVAPRPVRSRHEHDDPILDDNHNATRQ